MKYLPLEEKKYQKINKSKGDCTLSLLVSVGYRMMIHVSYERKFLSYFLCFYNNVLYKHTFSSESVSVSILNSESSSFSSSLGNNDFLLLTVALPSSENCLLNETELCPCVSRSFAKVF